MVSTAVIDDFLAQQHLAFVGVSHEPKEFSAIVYRVLKAHGYELHPVNPHAESVDGDACVASVSDLPDGIDGAIVMVPADASAGVVQDCIDRGSPGSAAQGRRTVLGDRRGGSPCAGSTASRWSTGRAR